MQMPNATKAHATMMSSLVKAAVAAASLVLCSHVASAEQGIARPTPTAASTMPRLSEDGRQPRAPRRLLTQDYRRCGPNTYCEAAPDIWWCCPAGQPCGSRLHTCGR
jgi:hypothetical protein